MPSHSKRILRSYPRTFQDSPPPCLREADPEAYQMKYSASASVKQQTGVSVMSDAAGIYLSGVGDAEVSIYAMSGTLLAKNVQDGFVPLPKATYIVKVNKLATKLMVK